MSDALAELGELAKTPDANIIKLPNISASIPQLKAAIAELQQQGYDLPDYPDDPKTDEDKDVRARYDKVKGSAVNPVLREGNSDRRAPASVKNYAKTHPHSMGAWTSGLQDQRRAHDRRRLPLQREVRGHREGRLAPHRAGRRRRRDHRAARVRAGAGRRGRRRHRDARGRAAASSSTAQIARAKAEDVLFSVHLKATMMKVSDPIIFGHVVRAFLPELFAQHGETLAAAGPQPQRRARRDPQGHRVAARGRRDQGHDRAGHRRRPRPGDGRLRPRHHQPARAERRDRRRLDAGDDPHLRPHVGPRRRGGRHPRGDPRLVVRRDLPGRHRRLPRERRLRPGHDGLGAQRRPDGAGGRGVRQPRQDLRDPAHRHGPRGRRQRRRACSSTSSPRATSGGCARPRTCRSATG